MSQLDAKEAALTALGRAYNDGFWHPTLASALDGVTAAQAAWKPAEDRNSIHELVRHLIHWKKAVLEDWQPFAGTETFRAYAQQDWHPIDTGEDVWRRDVAELMRASDALLEQVALTSLEQLSQPAEGMRVPRAWDLLNLATHDAYHTGQIVYLRKLQGT